jgi:drug/metabolite transporter (DMT)-like permease
MKTWNRANPLTASWMLLLATFFWGSSFVIQKSLVAVQQQLSPDAGTWLLTALSVIVRFGIAALLLVLWAPRRLKSITRLEVIEGLGLGLVGGLGLLFQMDGVNYTPDASTSAFLTQSYCIFIPLWVACRSRRWPSAVVGASSIMVLVGVGILSNINFQKLHLGRGELETLIASVFFTGQILWLERPAFQKNDPINFSIVMYLVTALMFVPIPFSIGTLQQVMAVYSAVPPVVLTLALGLLCSLVAYSLMNYWQPSISATHAGLIYCLEPVFTSLFELFLPGLISIWALIHYPNETPTLNKLIGGGLITAANILIIVQAARASKAAK